MSLSASVASTIADAAAVAPAAPVRLGIDNWADWWGALTQTSTWLDVLALLISAVLAWLLARSLAHATQLQRAAQAAPQAEQAEQADPRAAAPAQAAAREEEALQVWLQHQQQSHLSVLFGRRILDGALFPLLWLALAMLGRAALMEWVGRAPLLGVALPALTALALIRSVATVLRAAFPGVPALRLIERTLSWVVWLGMALWVAGVLPRLLAFLDTVKWKMGGATVSVAALLEGALTSGALMLLALWLSSLLEQRLLRRATDVTYSVRKAIANAIRAFMVFIGLLLGLSAVGIDLTALSVLSGAIGVGIGMGLQKLAANYISGFMVLAESSVRMGDLVRVDGFEGRITDIRARYTVIRAVGGAEAIVPNETLMTSTVENLSFSDSRLYQSTSVSVDYGCDPLAVQRLLIDAALACPRVLRDPAPSAHLANFGADGLDFTVGYWVGDPENGLGSARSQVNLNILLALRQAGVDIPYPQRVVHLPAAAAASAAAASAGLPQQESLSPKPGDGGGQS